MKKGYKKFAEDYFGKDNVDLPEDFNETVDFVINKYLLPEFSEVLKLYYGIDGEQPHTHREVECKLGLSRYSSENKKYKALWLLHSNAGHRYLKYGLKSMQEQNEKLYSLEDICDRKIGEVFDFPIRIHNSLMRGGYQTVGSVLVLSDDEILQIRNINKASLTKITHAIENVLRAYGTTRRKYLASIGKKIREVECNYSTRQQFAFNKEDYTEDEWKTITKIFEIQKSDKITIYGSLKSFIKG